MNDGLTKEQYIEAPIMAEVARHQSVELATIKAERDELKKAVAEYQGANPGPRGEGQPQGDNRINVVTTPYGDSQFMGTFRQGLREAGL